MLVARINSQFPCNPPLIYYRHVPFLSAAQRAAIWSVGEILVCTPIREGMNAFPLEFISVHHTLSYHSPVTSPCEQAEECKEQKQKPTPFKSSSSSSSPASFPTSSTPISHRPIRHNEVIVILSEFTAPARVLSGALYVNPWSVLETRTAYRKALSMKNDEREGRFMKLASYVTHNPTASWISHMLADISSIPLNKDIRGVSLGFGYFRHVIEMAASFTHLSPSLVGTRWLNARKKAVFLDYGGTLVDQDSYRGIDRLRAFSGKGSFRSPPANVQEALTVLCGCDDTYVFIVSGRSCEEMEQSLQSIPFLGLASEEGYFYRMPGK